MPHEKAGLLADTKEEMTKALLDLLHNEQMRSKLGQQGYQHIQEHFTWQKSVDKLLALYEELS